MICHVAPTVMDGIVDAVAKLRECKERKEADRG